MFICMGGFCVFISLLIIAENKKKRNVLGKLVKIGKKSDLAEVRESSMGAKRSFRNWIK